MCEVVATQADANVFRDAIADRVGVAQAFAFNDLYWLRARSRSFTASYDEFQWRLQELSLRAEPKQLEQAPGGTPG